MIIEAFDACLEFIWGQRYGRDNPHASDMKTAKAWVEQGLTVPIASIIFYKNMDRMHERWLHNIDPKDRKNLPALLSIFDDNIQAALNRVAIGGEFDAWEAEIGRWRARFIGWKNGREWNYEQWGPRPDQTGTRIPKEILTGLKPEGSKNTGDE